jgi:hypothetical protein
MRIAARRERDRSGKHTGPKSSSSDPTNVPFLLAGDDGPVVNRFVGVAGQDTVRAVHSRPSIVKLAVDEEFQAKIVGLEPLPANPVCPWPSKLRRAES